MSAFKELCRSAWTVEGLRSVSGSRLPNSSSIRRRFWAAGVATLAAARHRLTCVAPIVTISNGSDDLETWRKDVVILGAGFSHALYDFCPLTDTLGEIVRSRLSSEDRAKMPEGEFEDGRFEEWLSYLSEPQPHLAPEGVAEAALLAMRVTRVISEVLSEIQATALSADAEGWFYEFLSVLHVIRAQVITLNYDNFVECGVHTLGLQSPGWFGPTTVCEDDILAGLPPCANFPGRSAQSTALSTYDGDPVAAGERRTNTFKLWKLHGSLSWYWLSGGAGNSTLQRWRLPGVFGELWDAEEDHRRQELPSHEVFIVPPAALKGQRLREPVARELWRRASEALRTAERLALIGYSVPRADHSVMGMLTEGLQGRAVRIEVVNPRPDAVIARLLRLGVPAGTISSIKGEDCIARWSAAEVRRLARHAVEALKSDARLTGEVLMFACGPRVERFDRLDTPTDPSSPLTLHVVPKGQQCTKPLMYDDLRDALDTATECVIETDGRILPVIGHWVREGNSGVPMTQLHLVTSR